MLISDYLEIKSDLIDLIPVYKTDQILLKKFKKY